MMTPGDRRPWRIRLPLGRTALFLGALAAGLILLLPLRLALDWLDLGRSGFAAREARGSVWLGLLAEARVGDAPLGDLVARLDPFPLFVGRARIDLARSGDAGGAIEGAVSVSRHRFGIDDVTARVPLGQRMAPLPVAAIDLADVSIAFRDGLCDRAEGLVKAVIAGAPAGVALPGGLSGAARCDGGELMLPLVGQSGMESLTLHITAAGAYRADLRIRATTPAARDALLGAGFAPVAGGYALAVRGTL